MGICLDTEQHNNGSEDFDGTYRQQRGGSSEWHQQNPHEFRYTSTPPNGQFPMHNGGNVQFEPPKVPVIFVLGGPGSGKVTHCDNLMQEKRGIAHINMTDLLQQYAIGNDMQDFGQLSSKTVTEVLMLEMKMSPNAKTYLVSGYPRNMRDVVEYSEKIQVINGVILVAWRQKVLERQIDYGAKLGQVVLSLARMELNNFYKNVMPVADYFDQSGILITVNGERHPGEVYKDFRDAVIRILGQQDVPPDLPNGRPAAITDNVEPIVDQSTHPQRMIAPPPISQIPQPVPMVPAGAPLQRQQPPSNSDVITVRAHDSPMFNSPVKPGWPPVIWVIGGPGSNKATLCSQSIRQNPGWIHFSLGKLLRAAAESGSSTDARIMRDHISAGEMVPSDLAMQMIETHMGANITASGIIIDGFPRDIKQAGDFEAKFKQRPSMVLLDCSKLQLGRGRLDDSVSAFRRRLELFREVSLPMLKTMDNDGRLSIVDGDTGSAKVQEDFNRVIRQIIDESQSNAGNQGRQQQLMNNVNNQMSSNRPPVLPNGMAAAVLRNQRDPVVEDLESLTGIETVSRRVANGGQQLLNGFAAMNGRANGATMGNGHIGNGYANGVANGFANRAARLVSPSARNQVGDLYTTVANQRMNNMRNMYDMDYQANHI